MTKRPRAKPQRQPTPEPTTDLGPREARRHGDWIVPAGIRRAQRHPIHDRLYAAGRLSAAAWTAAACYADDYALAAGARDGVASVRVRSSGTPMEPHGAQIAAIGRIRAIRDRLGAAAVRVLDLACGEAVSIADLCRAMHARSAEHAMQTVCVVLDALAA
jgi:hypothetical protein